MRCPLRLFSTLLICSWALTACRSGDRAAADARLTLADALAADTTGYARALAPRAFRFPTDHGPHPGFKVEWWYVTGHLSTPSGRPFGFQFTVFRNALAPTAVPSSSPWATRQLYFGNLALSDIAQGRFYADERFARGDGRLAGAELPLRVWLDTWALQGTRTGFPLTLQADGEGFALSLTLDSLKPLVLQGEGGLSQKSDAPGNASYYYSYPRLAARGTVTVGGDTLPVSGQAWLDREWSTSALGKDQVGWDWFSLQLDSQEELMYYQLRGRDGTPAPTSSGTWVTTTGAAEKLTRPDVTLTPTGRWTSPTTGATYPSGWRLEVPSKGLDLTLTPRLPDQELPLSVHYWEGAVAVAGRRNGKLITGQGYVELTGYDTTAAARPR